VPIPQAKNLEELNEQLRSYCQQDEQRRITGKPMLVGELLAESHLTRRLFGVMVRRIAGLPVPTE
jgi:hypothetical protein